MGTGQGDFERVSAGVSELLADKFQRKGDDEDPFSLITQIEAGHGVRIILAVEGGSGAYKTKGPNSDIDLRFVFVRPIADYLGVHAQPDQITMRTSGFDVEGWDLRKAMRLARKSNPSINEWAANPEWIVMHQNGAMLRRYVESCTCLRSLALHYFYMARADVRKMSRPEGKTLKQLISALRAMLSARYIMERKQRPPLDFKSLAESAPDIAVTALDQLRRKREGEKALDALDQSSLPAQWLQSAIDCEGETIEALRDIPRNDRENPGYDDMLCRSIILSESRL